MDPLLKRFLSHFFSFCVFFLLYHHSLLFSFHQNMTFQQFTLFLLLLSFFPLLSAYKTCARTQGNKRALLLATDGLRPDLFETLLPQLPNIQSISQNGGRHQPCYLNSRKCARTVIRNPDPPFPLSSKTKGATQYFFPPSWGGVFSGVQNSKVSNNSHIAASNWAQNTIEKGGSFLKRAKDVGLKTAMAGVPGVLTGFWDDHSHTPVREVTPGVVDYECGYDDDVQLPLVAPDATSSCNLDYRLSISEEEYVNVLDNKTVHFGKTIINRGCAHIVVLHFNIAKYSMQIDEVATPEYTSSLLELDSLIGKVLQAVRDDSEAHGTSWLTMLVSDFIGKPDKKAPKVLLGGSMGQYEYLLTQGQHFFKDEGIVYVVGGTGDEVDLEEFVKIPSAMDTHPTILAHLGIRVGRGGGIDGVVNGVKEVPLVNSDENDFCQSSAWRMGGGGLGVVVVVLGVVGWLL